jgi:hypothetical protein
MAELELFEVVDGSLAVSYESIIGIEKNDDYSTTIFVRFGSDVRSLVKNIPYQIMFQMLQGRNIRSERRFIDSSAARSLEQLAKYQMVQVP